jgi:hypothetical protein
MLAAQDDLSAGAGMAGLVHSRILQKKADQTVLAGDVIL